MTSLETPITIPVHLAGSVVICCWIDIMETVLFFLVQNCRCATSSFSLSIGWRPCPLRSTESGSLPVVITSLSV